MNIHKQVRLLRHIRKLHKYFGITFAIWLMIISLTGLLLGVKKNTGGIILSESYKGSSTELNKWLPMDSLYKLALKYYSKSKYRTVPNSIERIDIRKDKGMAKFIFTDDYIALQLDCSTGKLLHIENRRADLIENIHDGSILDKYFNTIGEPFKLFYTIIISFILFGFCITGLGIWYIPKIIRKNRKNINALSN